MLRNTFKHVFSIFCPFLPFKSTSNFNTIEAHRIQSLLKCSLVETVRHVLCRLLYIVTDKEGLFVRYFPETN